MSAAHVAKLIAPEFTIPSQFGDSVALDGDTVLIGDRDDGVFGAAYVFTYNAGVWSFQQRLVAPDGTRYASFGDAVALNGDTALIGAHGDDDGSSSFSGSAYVFTRTDGVWTLQQKLLSADGNPDNYFGGSLALDGDTALIGASSDDDNGSGSGSVYVFKRAGGVWAQQQKLMASEGVEYGGFGRSIALDSDSALISAPGVSNQNDIPGSAYVFTRTGGVWSQHQELLPADGERTDFGFSVALDSDTALISDYIFTRDDGVWSEMQQLVAPEAMPDDEFGFSVALSGDTALIGAPADDDEINGRDVGSFYLFKRNGDTWSRQRNIVAADGTARDDFGTSVALDGDTALIGAPGDRESGDHYGSAYVYDLSDDGTSVDGDEDGVPDTVDNCPAQYNPLQEDTDSDLTGDACDTDDDNDSILDDEDNCPLTVNTDQANFDNDGAGDICDDDDDNDGVPDSRDLAPFDPTIGEGIEVTISRAILSSADDVEQRGGRVAVDSKDLELGDNIGYKKYVGLRFADLAIPQGAIILDARVLFWVDEQNDESTAVTLQGVDSDDAGPWLSDGFNVSRRLKTNASIDWSPAPWTDRGAAPIEQTQSPDLSSIVQEIVDRAGWQAGNALSLVSEGRGRRVAYSYDQLSGRKAPVLTVRYATVEGNQAPSVELGSDLEVLRSDALTLKGQVQDDGLPASPGTTSLAWSKLTGPGMVNFDDPSSATSAMTFSTNGRYELELRAFDGALIGLDRIIINVIGELGEKVIERRIASNEDDAEEELMSTGGAGPVDLYSSDLELAEERGPQVIGLRFADLAIPSGTTITRAWVQFTVDETRKYNPVHAVIDLRIQGESTADAMSFDESIGNVSNRVRTKSSVSWAPPPWERIDDVGEAQRTPDLSAILQEIVDDANGWQSGNALVLLIDGIGGRVAESFDGENHSAPLLHVEYE